jgi:NAD(P)-dependent dehydrogenase (short-subunit alcohol dehydrogenase family)
VEGKLVMVTGANAGIGKVTALELAKMGAHVILVCRSEARGAQALNEIKAESGSKNIDLLLADLSSQTSIRNLADKFKQNYGDLDVLVNNAGAVFTKRQKSVDGLEMTFALNHLNYFLLTNLLLDRLKQEKPTRIVNVSSAAHQGSKLNFDDLQNEISYGGMRAYGQSKLANILFTYELARRLEGSQITTNCLHPGFGATNFGKNNGRLMSIFMSIIGPIAGKSPQKGAETTIYLASAPEVSAVSGKYFSDKKAVKSSAASYNEADAERLWTISEELTNLAVTV